MGKIKTMFNLVEIILVLFLVLSLVISTLPFIKKKKYLIDENANEIIEFIIKGTTIILKRFYLFLMVTTISVVLLGITVKLINNIPFIRLILIIPSVITSFIAGWISLKFSMKSIKMILSYAQNSPQKIMNFCNLKSNFILTFLISFILLDLSIWIIGINKALEYNLFSISEVLIKSMGYQWSPEILYNVDFLNLKNLFLSTTLAGYVIGSTMHSILARFNFSIFSTSFDTAADLIGFNKYDFPEDDLRNPGSIPDLIGDQLKNNYLIFSNLHSCMIILIVAISILGSFIGLINHTQNSFILIFFPLLFTSFGLLINSLVTQLINYLNIVETKLFAKKFFQLICNSTLLVIGLFLLNKYGNIPNNIIKSVVIGFASVIVLYPILYWVLSIKSKVVKFVATCSSDSILNTISSGLFIGFLMAFVIAIGICITLGKGVLITGKKVNLFLDFYHIGCISLSLLIGSFPIISTTLSKPLLDNSAGIAEMLSYDLDQRQFLQKLNAYSNISVAFFNTIITIVVMLSSCMYLLFYILKSLKTANLISYFSNISDTKLLDPGTLIHNLELQNFIIPFQVHFLNGKFLLGSILGVSFLFGFIALIMWGVSVSYKKINFFIKQELKNNPEIWEGSKCPNYFNLIQEITTFSNKFMLMSFVLCISLIIFSWIKIGVAGTIGFLIAQITFGSILSLFFSYSGTIWANTKFLIESDIENIGKPVHIAVLFSDKLGDIFKDAIAPFIIDNIKFIILLGIIMVGLILKFDQVII